MYRNTNWNKEFMEFWYANGTEFFYKDQLEQSSLIKIIKNSPDILKRNIKLVNNRLFNSYYHVWHEKEKFYTLAIDFKQGLYNYQYAKLENGKIITLPLPYLPDTSRKNSYTVLLYYQNPMKYRSEVVGLANVLY